MNTADVTPAPAWRRWDAHIASLAAAIDVRIDRATSPAVAAHARLVFLDTFGCALAGRAAPEVAALERHAALREPGDFRFPRGEGLALRPATQVLAIGPTWHEACEGHAFAHGRPGIATIAALLPLACARGATLAEFTDALAMGYEIGARAGGWLRINAGLHVDGNWPGLGVAAGVGRLIGLDADQAKRAVDVAACQLPCSLYLPIRTGRSVRNGYLAHSAMLGLDAAFAVEAGFDAPHDALGYYAEHFCRAAPEPLPPPTADLLADTYLKPFAAVRHVHYGALAARRIRERSGIETGQIRGIVLDVYEEATVYCANPNPATPLAAQFSLSFGVAAMLRTGTIDAGSYDPLAFADAELRRLEALVEIRVDPDLTRERSRGARLTVRTPTGTWTETVADSDPDLSLTTPGVTAKFIRNAEGVVPAAVATAFCETVLGPSDDVSMRELLAML